MSNTRVEILIKGLDRFDVVAVSDFPYRLNRTVFVATADKLKSLGGTFSTKIKLSKDKSTNRVFVGKADFKSFGKFNSLTDYAAIIKEDGAVIARGIFRLESSTSKNYEGTFFDSDASWIDDLGKIKLNKLGYVNDSPTWLVNFNGSESFDEVNDLSNRETDFVVPTVIYNNTPVVDYLDFTDSQIWGVYDNGNLETPPLSFPNEFKVVKGFADRLRHGLKFDHFPPAFYYRNILERIAAEIGLSIECSLFYEDWFNALIIPYTGNGFLYNWKNIGSVYSSTPSIIQSGEIEFDETETTDAAEPSTALSINKLMLPQTDQAPTHVWILEEQFTFKAANIIKHDHFYNQIDKATLTNNFEREGAYLVPADGKYKIAVASQIYNRLDNFSYREPFSFYWDGGFLFNAFGGWDLESQNTTKPAIADRWFGWDDSVLVVLRTDQSGQVDQQTKTKLYEWMNGFNKDFTNDESDAIAYFSPKRWALQNGGANIPNSEVLGSPYTNFESDVIVGDVVGQANFAGHTVVSAVEPLISKSYGKIEVEVELNAGDNVKIMWVSLCNIYGLVARDATPDEYDHAANPSDVSQQFGNAAFDGSFSNVDRAEWSINYLCGEYDLDVAANLPDITAKDFVASFMKQFNLHYIRQDKTISFYPVKQYFSKIPYDITDRVDMSEGWKSEPIDTPATWSVGYDNDDNDRLLKTASKKGCSVKTEDSNNYANVSFSSENTYRKDEIKEYNMFSATKFVKSKIAINPFGWGLDSFPYNFHTTTSPVDSSLELIKGFTLDVIAANIEYNYYFPSIQSEDSYNTETVGDWFLDFNYSPRLLYHFGTANKYTNYTSNNYGSMIDAPRADIVYMNLKKHWFRPTVSGFDGENATLTGVNFPTLRYDTENGLYKRYFENLLELFNLSERLTLSAALTPKDWNNLKGDKKIRFLGQLYRLMEIKDYDPVTRQKAIIYLLKEV